MPFEDIEEFYRRLEGFFPKPDRVSPGPPESTPSDAPPRSNTCGTCDECCRYYFYLSRYEFDLIEAFLIQRFGESPIEFVTSRRASDDERLQGPVDPEARCPLYADGVGCTVYDVRPLACRLMGPYIPHTSKLPSWCVFDDPIPYSRMEDAPLWDEYLQLQRRHPTGQGYFRLKRTGVAGQIPVRPPTRAAGPSEPASKAGEENFPEH